MEEFALFQKMTPDRTLGKEQRTEGKHNKSCITINFACNVTFSHKSEPWFIRKALKPCCFGCSFINIKIFKIVWQKVKKAYMTGKIFKKYLLQFHKKMVG